MNEHKNTRVDFTALLLAWYNRQTAKTPGGDRK